MIEFLYELWVEMVSSITANFDPWRDTLDIVLVALGVLQLGLRTFYLAHTKIAERI